MLKFITIFQDFRTPSSDDIEFFVQIPLKFITSHFCLVAVTAHGGIETVGRKLVQFETGLRPMSWNFEMYAGNSEVMVAIVSFTSTGSSRLDVLVLKWDSEDEIVLERLCQTTTPFRTERIHIQSEIVCATGRRNDSKCATVVFLNPRTQRSVCMDTGLLERNFRFDSFPASATSLMLYREEGDDVQTYCYPDVLDLLKQHGGSVANPNEHSKDRSPIPIVHIPPLPGQRYVFEKDCRLDNREEWFVTHPWNTPNFSRGDNAISIMTTSRAEGSRPGAADAMVTFVPTYRTLTHHWFTPPSSEDLADPHLSLKPAIPIRRWMFHVADTIGVGVDRSEIICPGSNGTHLLWVWGNVTITEGEPFDSDDPEEDLEIDIRIEKRIHIATLPQDPESHPSQPDYPSEAVVRDLLIDPNTIDLARIATTDIEDCHGIVGLAMNLNERRESFIHLLSY
ncbi:hypothetical protein FRC05_005528 [Tulasnella sp. 425]|nr:hypothetical protein FRC05_005528 [Tulasnella sp. 425]